MSVKKWSMLGLVLMAASAVTAAVLPKNADNNKAEFDGTLTASSLNDENSRTCRATESGIVSGCNITTASAAATTVSPALTSGVVQTGGNTTAVDTPED